MHHVHPFFNWQDIESDDTISTSYSDSLEAGSDINDASADSRFSQQDDLVGMGATVNVHVSITADGIPLPIDLFVAIGEHLRLSDLPRFFSTNRAMRMLYDEDRIGYAKSLCKIGSALRLSEIVDALAAINQYSAEQQPYLLCTLAKNIRMQTLGPVFGATKKWQAQIDAQFDWHDARPSGPARERALQQLIIARGLAVAERHFPRKGRNLQSIVGDRLKKLSPEYWPSVFEAFLPGADVINLLRASKFKEEFTGKIASVSEELALMIAFDYLRPPHEYTDVSALMQNRFGVNEADVRENLDPLIAIAIANAAMRQPSHLRYTWLMNNSQQWRRHDEYFTSLATDAFIKLFDADAYRKHAFSYLLKADLSSLPNLRRRVRDRTMMLESPTINALRKTGRNAEAHVNAFLRIIDRISECSSKNEYIALLREIKGLPYVTAGMPLVARPALLHRLVLNAHIGWTDRHTADTFIDAAIDCRNALAIYETRNSPLMSRASAALILGAITLRKYDTPRADLMVTEASGFAFLYVASDDWGDVLQALIHECTLGQPLTVKKLEKIDTYTALFVCRPNASARHLPDLANRIEQIAGSVWGRLPDKADEGRSRFEVFKHRVGIASRMGDIALTSIAESLAPQIVAGVRLLEDVASAASFDDPEAISALEKALFTQKIRATLRADSDIDAITSHYTQRSLYLRSLIAKAVRDLATPSHD